MLVKLGKRDNTVTSVLKAKKVCKKICLKHYNKFYKKKTFILSKGLPGPPGPRVSGNKNILSI